MTAPQTNKRATAKNLLAARITLVEELGDALDAHSKAVAAAAQARQHAEKTTEAARTAFEAAKASGPPPNSTAPTTRTRSSARAPSYPVLGADEHARNLRSPQPQVTPPLRPPVKMRRTPLRNARRGGRYRPSRQLIVVDAATARTYHPRPRIPRVYSGPCSRPPASVPCSVVVLTMS